MAVRQVREKEKERMGEKGEEREEGKRRKNGRGYTPYKLKS